MKIAVKIWDDHYDECRRLRRAKKVSFWKNRNCLSFYCSIVDRPYSQMVDDINPQIFKCNVHIFSKFLLKQSIIRNSNPKERTVLVTLPSCATDKRNRSYWNYNRSINSEVWTNLPSSMHGPNFFYCQVGLDLENHLCFWRFWKKFPNVLTNFQW